MTASPRPTAYELRGATAWITLSRPAKLNAVTDAMLAAIDEDLTRAEADGARVVVLTGAGKAFCAGADLSDALRESTADLHAIAETLRKAGELTLRMERLRMPVIAAVNGPAVAGGLELVLACDLVVAAESATFSDGHANFGLFPGAGASIRLPRLIGANRARELMYTARTLSAAEMRELGVVNRVVPGDELASATTTLADRIGRAGADGIAAMKRVIGAGLTLPIEQGIALELETAVAHLKSADVAEGLTAFAEGRRPNFNRETR
ncbi:enoyl-CoA hydratase/isomerase family protein [Nocardia inohanensis]|uniref:enoyl-CoA hydratase/isomerase family protein n=1 Tax=Nocardia inohanensis TaxID=209246 RepID=UPI000834DB64|nr:enoyl-CoA hydratase-related protein [Nocardia inohanensis]